MSQENDAVPCIDSHVHFWEYRKERDTWMKDMKILQQDYLPNTLTGTLRRNGVDGCVAVQASQEELETHFLVELSRTYPIIRGVVGWVDLQKADITQRLEYFSQYPVIKGWRHVVQGEPAGFLKRPEFINGINALATYGFTYDLLIYHHQLKEALEFATQFPDQPMIIDHCAKPAIKDGKTEDWKKYMQLMAELPHMHCKISGLFTEADWKQWKPADFYPYLDIVFEAFGTDRLLFGSDWPVLLNAGIYVQWKSLLEKYMDQFSAEDREKVFGGNATKIYKLPCPPAAYIEV